MKRSSFLLMLLTAAFIGGCTSSAISSDKEPSRLSVIEILKTPPPSEIVDAKIVGLRIGDGLDELAQLVLDKVRQGGEVKIEICLTPHPHFQRCQNNGLGQNRVRVTETVFGGLLINEMEILEALTTALQSDTDSVFFPFSSEIELKFQKEGQSPYGFTKQIEYSVAVLGCYGMIAGIGLRADFDQYYFGYAPAQNLDFAETAWRQAFPDDYFPMPLIAEESRNESALPTITLIRSFNRQGVDGRPEIYTRAQLFKSEANSERAPYMVNASRVLADERLCELAKLARINGVSWDYRNRLRD